VSGNELGTLIRGKREGITPADVGLPAGSRRRTPGLRRTELAMLAGISVEYLTRIEQGRDRNPSPQVLGALADALMLSPDERMYLLFVSKDAAGATFAGCPSSQPPTREVRPTVQAILDRLEPAPALLLNRATDILAYTEGYERLARPLGVLDRENPNLVYYLFADRRAKEAFPDWDRVADDHMAALRAACSPADEHLQALANELTVLAGGEFTDRMAGIPGPERRTGVERFAHPEAGELRLLYETLHLDGQRLVVYVPADNTASAALDLLVGIRPGALRSVTA
jgi:transcriptional regulator with XRE-family HTH domain